MERFVKEIKKYSSLYSVDSYCELYEKKDIIRSEGISMFMLFLLALVSKEMRTIEDWKILSCILKPTGKKEMEERKQLVMLLDYFDYSSMKDNEPDAYYSNTNLAWMQIIRKVLNEFTSQAHSIKIINMISSGSNSENLYVTIARDDFNISELTKEQLDSKNVYDKSRPYIVYKHIESLHQDQQFDYNEVVSINEVLKIGIPFEMTFDLKEEAFKLSKQKVKKFK